MAEDSAGIITVTCGNLVGKLHMDKFICPGIHRECIEFDGRFISPKLFSVMGEKEKLKDWKNAVRMNGIQLRKYIESGQLDFTNHQELCTGRCVPRAPLKTMVFDDGTVAPFSSLLAGTGIVLKENNYVYDSEESNMNHTEASGSQNMYISQYYNRDDWHYNHDIKPNVEVLHKTITLDNSDEQPPDESQLFWKGIIELGLADEIFREIKTTLDNLKLNLIRNNCQLDEVRKVSTVVNELGLSAKLKYRLAAHKTDMERQKDKLDKEMEELRRRVAEAEHKKELLKRKSQCFDHLLEISKTAKCQGLKADSSTLYNMHASSPSPDSSQLPEREALATVHVKNLTSSAPLSSSSSSSSSGLLALTPSASCSSGSRSNSRTESPVSTEETRATS